MLTKLQLTLLSAVALLVGCADPTEIRLHIRTNLPCTDRATWKGVAIYVGPVGANIEQKAPALSTTTCDQYGQVGSLVVVPSGAKDAELSLRVVAGLSHNPEDCASYSYQGCVVARRAVRFDHHAALDLEIDLNSDCRDIGCDATHSCLNSVCIDSHALTSVESLEPSEAGPSAAANVRCGDDGLFCPTKGNICCIAVDPITRKLDAACVPPKSCPTTSITLYCDDESDCSEQTSDAGVGMCMLDATETPSKVFVPASVHGTQCVLHPGTMGVKSVGLEMCEDRAPCLGGKDMCHGGDDDREVGDPPNPLPGYHWCNISEPLLQ